MPRHARRYASLGSPDSLPIPDESYQQIIDVAPIVFDDPVAAQVNALMAGSRAVNDEP